MAQVVYTGDDDGRVVSFDPSTPLFLRYSSEGDASPQTFNIWLIDALVVTFISTNANL